ncbi:MAG: hypothetical protein L7H00_02185 [Vulcanisaeta sp.]|nr:hypothetical protein [Vulcanisaeta sp.]MCG2892321.1 hypothetical protein [Vulcanisaeta sp.]MCG2894797.1 hypothetical protein [Vulcanisaeta sp.]
MPVMIKFYMVVGRDEPYESVIRSVVNEVREKFKGGEKSINATFIRIKPEAVDAALNALNMPENQVPQNLIYLVRSMKQDGVKALPALIINGRKIYEGQLPPPDTVRQTVMGEIMALLAPTQPTPQPTAPQQPPTMQVTKPPTQPQVPTPPETKPTPPPQPQVETLSAEVKPLKAVEERPASTVVAPIQPITVPSGVRVMIGRPNDCRECIYYGANTGTCLLFGYKVTDPSRPPCKS